MDFRFDAIRELLAVQRMRRATFDPDQYKTLCAVLVILFGVLIVMVMALAVVKLAIGPVCTFGVM